MGEADSRRTQIGPNDDPNEFHANHRRGTCFGRRRQPSCRISGHVFHRDIRREDMVVKASRMAGFLTWRLGEMIPKKSDRGSCVKDSPKIHAFHIAMRESADLASKHIGSRSTRAPRVAFRRKTDHRLPAENIPQDFRRVSRGSDAA